MPNNAEIAFSQVVVVGWWVCRFQDFTFITFNDNLWWDFDTGAERCICVSSVADPMLVNPRLASLPGQAAKSNNKTARMPVACARASAANDSQGQAIPKSVFATTAPWAPSTDAVCRCVIWKSQRSFSKTANFEPAQGNTAIRRSNCQTIYG